jgi:hypothetical protein
MAIESGSYISDLEPLNPASTDLLKQADDHLRLIKSVLKNTFPNITGPVTLTQDQINSPASSVPVGAVMLWYGSSASIPSGFALCNGQTTAKSDGSGSITTPNLVNRIPMGAGSTVAQGATAGGLTASASTAATTANITGTTDAGGDHTHAAGTLTAPAPSVTAQTRTGDYSIVGSNTGPEVTGITVGAGGAVSGSTASGGSHTHNFTGTANIGSLNINISTLNPVLGLHFIMKV